MSAKKKVEPVKPVKWIVAESTDQTYNVGWGGQTEHTDLDAARIDMHQRAQRPEITLVAIFPNTRKALKEGRYRYSIDKRDKTKWAIGSHVGGILDNLPSDWF